MSKKIQQPFIKVKEEEIHFSNLVQTHTKAELNPVFMRSQWQGSQGQPWGQSLAQGSHQKSSTTTKTGEKSQFPKTHRCCCRSECLRWVIKGLEFSWGHVLPVVGRGSSQQTWGWVWTSHTSAMWRSALTNNQCNQSRFLPAPDSCLKGALFEANQKPLTLYFINN